MEIAGTWIPGLNLVVEVDGVTTTSYVNLDQIDLDDPLSVDEMVGRIRELELEGRALRRWWAAAVEADGV
jgi:hypothetical protein